MVNPKLKKILFSFLAESPIDLFNDLGYEANRLN